MPRVISSKPTSSRKRLTLGQIRSAIRTVRVRSSGKSWSVKKVADSRIRRFATKEEALDCARELAAEAKWTVVLHDKNGKITRITPRQQAARRHAEC